MSDCRVVRLKVRFEDRSEAASCLQDLRRLPGTIVNVLRGRITPEMADYEIEIRGQRKFLDRAVRSLWKVIRQPSDAEAELQQV